MNVTELVEQVRSILMDDGTNYSDIVLAGYLRDGELAVGYLRPDQLLVSDDVTLQPGARQTLDSATTVRLRGVLGNRGRLGAVVDGPPVRPVSRGVMDGMGVAWRGAPPDTVVREYIYDEREPLEFDVYPPMLDDQTVILVQRERVPPAYPFAGTTIAPAAVISIASKYAPSLIEWCLYRALSQQNDLTAATMDGQTHYQAFLTLMGISVQSDAAASLKARAHIDT